MRAKASLLLGQILIAVAFLSSWQVLVTTGKLDKFFFSRPSDIAARIATWLQTGSIWPHLFVTLEEAALAFVLGAGAGILCGFALARSPRLGALADPFIKMLNALPRVVLAPIFLLWFGLGIWSKVALGVTVVFFIVFFNTHQGVRDVDKSVVDNARMLGASEWQLTRHVLIPERVDLGIFEPPHQHRIRGHRGGGRRISRRVARRRVSDFASRRSFRHDRSLRRHGCPQRLGIAGGFRRESTGTMAATVEIMKRALLLICLLASDAASPGPVRLVLQPPSTNNYPSYFASWLGFYKEEGVDVSISQIAGASKILEAVVGGSADVGGGVYEQTLQMAAEGKSIVAFVSLLKSPNFAIIAAARHPQMGGPAGKTVGVSSVGSPSQFYLTYL